MRLFHRRFRVGSRRWASVSRNSGFSTMRQILKLFPSGRGANIPVTVDMLLNSKLDLSHPLQCLVPATFKLVRHQPVFRVRRIVLISVGAPRNSGLLPDLVVRLVRRRLACGLLVRSPKPPRPLPQVAPRVVPLGQSLRLPTFHRAQCSVLVHYRGNPDDRH